MTSKEILQHANDRFEALEHKKLERKSFMSGYNEGVAVGLQLCKQKCEAELDLCAKAYKDDFENRDCSKCKYSEDYIVTCGMGVEMRDNFYCSHWEKKDD